MAINWPVSPTIGQLYTSSNGDVWRWNGYAWDISNLQSSGSYKGPWIIFRDPRKPNYYANLPLALAGATSGETIYLATDVTETYSGPLSIEFNINLNGNTFTIVESGGYFGNQYIIIGSVNLNTNIQNGNIIFSGTNKTGIVSNNSSASHDLTGLSVTITSNLQAGSFNGSLEGGSFYNNSTDPTSIGVQFRSTINGEYEQQTINQHVKNVKGVSAGGYGISITSNFA